MSEKKHSNRLASAAVARPSLIGRLVAHVRHLNRERLRRRHLVHAVPAAGSVPVGGHLGVPAPPLPYEQWIARFDDIEGENLLSLKQRLADLPVRPLLSLVMPVYNPDLKWLDEAIASVRRQLYPNWELCIADDASTDPAVLQRLHRFAQQDRRIRVVARERNGHISACSNSALELVRGSHVGWIDQDDVLREHALLLMAEAIGHWPQAQMLYSDEDKLDAEGVRCEPYFKPDWNPELLLGQNYPSHFTMIATERVRRLGGLRVGFEGAQDHDLLLRCTEGLDPRPNGGDVIHIPHILYHWRMHQGSTSTGDASKSYAARARIKAVQEHLDRRGLAGRAVDDGRGGCRVIWQRPDPAPKVSILVPTRNGLALLRTCLESVLSLTTYPNYEILVIDNGSDDPATLEYLQEIVQRDRRVQVMRDDRPFNYSALNNAAVRRTQGELLVLLNNDIEVITPEWLDEMVALAVQDGVGAVGARLLYGDGRLQHGGVILLGPRGIAGHAHKFFARDCAGYMGRAMLLQSFSAVTAACLVLRRSHFEAVGGLDEQQLAVAFNDVDLCLKLRESGLRNVWTPHAELYHHESVSRGADDTPAKAERFRREVECMSRRWGTKLERDPAYSPWLALEREDMCHADVPRVSLSEPWFLTPAPSAAIEPSEARAESGHRQLEQEAA
ncbi:MAG: hypothetical protein RLZZ592_2693 [Pseudomonadota bacterium]|jgi:glycosyltransferase involved in cell wall biosynthesis